MMRPSKLSWRVHAITTIQRRESRSKFWRLGAFLVLTLAFLICSLIVINTLRYVELNLVLIEDAPLLLPLMGFALLVGIYLSLVSLIHSSREISTGALELLLCGPVDEASFILGEFLTQLRFYFLAAVIFLFWALLCAWQLNLILDWLLPIFILSTFLPVATFVALGQASAILGGKTRASLIYFFLIMGGFAGLHLADTIVTNLVISNSSTITDPMLYIRDILSAINNVIQWISPFAIFQNIIQAVTDNSPGAYLLNAAIGLAETAGLLALSIFTLTKRGIRR